MHWKYSIANNATMKNALITKVTLLIASHGFIGIQAQAMTANAATKIPVLIELFTSEGCSSCPPADRLLEFLDEEQPFSSADLIVLSEHVDYWNGDGWVDPYSSRVFSERQRRYADQFGLESVYTPQVVIDGQRQTVGSDSIAIRNAVQAVTRSEKVALTLSNIVRDHDRIKMHLASSDLTHNNGPATVYIALADNKVQSNVAGGENGGRSLTHVAVARALFSVGTVKTGSSFSQDMVIPLPAHTPANGIRIVVFLQDDKSHKILGATEEKI
jgi:hypothetical protein